MNQTLNQEVKTALVHKLTALADDELILAHRNSEWTGHAPILEEDIALANIAQDELGHATLWYGLLEPLDSSDADALVYTRDMDEWRNVQFVELPKGDWAFTMLRQYLFDMYEQLYLKEMTKSSYGPLVEVVQKMLREERFHLQHTHAWVKRLGLGTEESNTRMQRALEELWPYAQGLFVPLENEAQLVEAGIFPDLEEVKEGWVEYVTAHLEASNLFLPSDEAQLASREVHTPHLEQLLEELQMVARLEPEGTW